MLGQNFIKIQGTTIPTPATLTENFTNIEEVNQSEAGTDRVIVARLQKKSYNLTFQVTEYWKNQLLSFGALNQVSFQVGTENTLSGRFRITSSTLQKNSNLYTTALYTIQATFTQI